jgi:MFS family permease
MSSSAITSAPGRLLNRSFVLLWQGRFVSHLGTQMAVAPLVFWAKDATGSASAIGALTAAALLPVLLLAPVGGVIADRYSRRNILVVCDLLRGVSTLSLAGLMFLSPDSRQLIFAWMLGVSVLGGVLAAFFTPAASAAIPSLVPDHRVPAANSMLQGSAQVAKLLGQGVSGLLFRLLGAPLILLIDALTFFVAAVSEMFVAIPQQVPPPPETWRQVRARFFAELKEGLRYVWGRTGLRNGLFAAIAMSFFGLPFMVLFPFYVEEVLGATPDWYGYLLAFGGLGGLLGFTAAGSLRLEGRARSRAMLAALATAAASVGSMGVIQDRYAALAAVGLAGFMESFFFINLISVIQRSTADHMRGRTSGILQTLTLGLSPVSVAATGLVADLLDQDVQTIFLGCGCILVSLAALVSCSREFRRFLAFQSPRRAGAVAAGDEPHRETSHRPHRQPRIRPGLVALRQRGSEALRERRQEQQADQQRDVPSEAAAIAGPERKEGEARA